MDTRSLHAAIIIEIKVMDAIRSTVYLADD